MFGAILGAVGGLLGNIGGGQNGGGLLGGLGGIAGKLLDPLGLFCRNEDQRMPEETKEMMEMMRDMIHEVMEMMREHLSETEDEEGSGPCACDYGVEQSICATTGSGDDRVTIG